MLKGERRSAAGTHATPHYGREPKLYGRRIDSNRKWLVYRVWRVVFNPITSREDYLFLAICGDDRRWLRRVDFKKVEPEEGIGQAIDDEKKSFA